MYVSIPPSCIAHGGQKRASELWGLELQKAVSWELWKLGTEPGSSAHALLSHLSSSTPGLFNGDFLRAGTVPELSKNQASLWLPHCFHLLPCCFSQVHIGGIRDTEEERIKEAAAYIAQRTLLASEKELTASKKSTASKQSKISKQATSTLQREETFEKKSRSVAIREKAEELSLRKTVRRANVMLLRRVEMCLRSCV